MRRLKGVDGNVFANEDVFEEIINNPRFSKFVGDCITHYLSTKTARIQDYPVPEDVSENFATINISKITSEDKLYITENGILDE